MARLTEKSSLIASVLAAIGASVCCVGPLVLLALGIGGSWVGSLTAMEPYRPFFIGMTLLFLGLAFRKLYLVPQVCTPGTPCADPRTRQRQRLTFWIVTVLLLGLLAVPWFAPLFYRKETPMRKLLIALLAAIPLTVLAATPKTVTLAVQNMTCELCPITVKKSLEKVPGVSAVKVDFDRKTAIVTYDADKAQPEALTKATTNAGYPSTVQK